MRTTLDIPENLISEAMKATGAKTKSELIKMALEEQILKAKRLKLLTYKGKVDLDIDLDITRDRGE